MSVLDELRAESGNGGACIFARWLVTLSKATQDELDEAFADESITSAALTRWAKRNGYTGAEGGVRLHRTAGCLCRK